MLEPVAGPPIGQLAVAAAAAIDGDSDLVETVVVKIFVLKVFLRVVFFNLVVLKVFLRVFFVVLMIEVVRVRVVPGPRAARPMLRARKWSEMRLLVLFPFGLSVLIIMALLVLKPVVVQTLCRVWCGFRWWRGRGCSILWFSLLAPWILWRSCSRRRGAWTRSWMQCSRWSCGRSSAVLVWLRRGGLPPVPRR